MSAGESTIEAFEAAPVGKTVRGPTYLVWCVDASLCVSAIWGCPNEADVRALVRLCDVAFHPAMHAPYDTIIDVRGLKSAADAAGFAVLTNYLRERKQLKTRIRRQEDMAPDPSFRSHAPAIYTSCLPSASLRSSFQRRR